MAARFERDILQMFIKAALLASPAEKFKVIGFMFYVISCTFYPSNAVDSRDAVPGAHAT